MAKPPLLQQHRCLRRVILHQEERGHLPTRRVEAGFHHWTTRQWMITLPVNKVSKLQNEDAVLRQLRVILESNEQPPLRELATTELKTYVKHLKKYRIKNNVIYRNYHGKDIPVLPVSEFARVFEYYHRPGHTGANKTTETILKSFYMYDLSRMTRLAVASCYVCLKRGNIGIGKAPFQHAFALKTNDRIHIDLIGQFPRRTPEGYYYILTIIDVYSKHLTCVPLTNNTADNILDKMTIHYFHVHGYPRSIITDQGHELTGGSFHEFCTKVGIDIISIPAHHPRGNGVVERINKTIKSYLNKLTEDRMFRASDLSACCFHYNTSIHNSLKETPFFMKFNQDPTIEATLYYEPEIAPLTMGSNATDYIVRNQERRRLAEIELKASFDRCDKLHRSTLKNNEYKINDPVMVRNHRKIYKTEAEFLTGFEIIEKVNEYTYIVRNNVTGRKTKLHVEDIKIDLKRNNDSMREDEEETENNETNDNDNDNNNNNNNNNNNDNAPTHSKEERMVLRPRKTIRSYV